MIVLRVQLAFFTSNCKGPVCDVCEVQSKFGKTALLQNISKHIFEPLFKLMLFLVVYSKHSYCVCVGQPEKEQEKQTTIMIRERNFTGELTFFLAIFDFLSVRKVERGMLAVTNAVIVSNFQPVSFII